MGANRAFVGTALVVLMALVTTSAEAQTQNGQIVGQVTDGQTGAPISEVQVYLTGTGLGVLTRQNGRFILLNVPPGTYELTAERIGLGSVTGQISVAAGQTVEADFSMQPVALGLDEIVVTGTAGAARRREIGNTVSQIVVPNLPERPVLVSDLLQAAAPGLDVYGGGTIGQSKIIRLRGESSVSLSNHPLVYIDGVRIRSEPLPDINPPDRRGGRSANVAVSPLDNINPNDIERIEIIKGSAATTLYGTEASAGVIQVFTKSGTQGVPVWTAELQGGKSWSREFGVTGSGVQYNHMEHWLCTGIYTCGEYANQSYAQQYNLSVRGGGQDLRYFISGSFVDQQGYLTNDTEEKYAVRGNFTVAPAENMTIQWNTAYVNQLLTMTNGQNNAQGITLNAFRAERNYFGTGDPAVLNELMDQTLDQGVERMTTGGVITYAPMENLTNRLTVGYDWSQQEHRNLRPFAWKQVPLGALLNNTFQSRVLSFDYVGTVTFGITANLLGMELPIRSNFSWGGQATGTDDRTVEAFGENFPGAAAPTVNSAAITQGFEVRQKIWNSGFFFQNVFDIADKYFLTVGTRVDGHSAFGKGFGLQVYPKASASWILSDESFYPDIGEMKLRAAFGRSGRAPGAFDAVRTWSPVGLAGNAAFVPENVGNEDVGPEVTEEIEYGFDASWWDNRIETSFTYYEQITNDALLNVPLVPSTGFTNSVLTNIGTIQNVGFEVDLDAALIQGADWGLDIGVNYSTNHSKVLELGIPETNELRMDCGPNGDEGCTLRNVRNEVVTNPDEIADPIYERINYGPNLPTTFISPSMTVRLPKGIVLSARGDYKGGFYMTEAVWSITRSVRSPLCFPYYVDPQNSIELKTGIPAIWKARCDPSEYEGYVWKGDFFKVRSVSATIPMDFAFPEKVSNATLTLALNNSYLWMRDMPYMDPEAQADPYASGQQGYNFEETVPAPIVLRASLRITF